MGGDAEEMLAYAGAFTVSEGMRPMKLQPLGGSEIGGDVVTIMGTGFSDGGAYEVHFGNVQVKGLYDTGQGALLIRVPPLRPGPHVVRITQNGQDFVSSPAPYFSMYATRVHVMREVENKDASAPVSYTHLTLPTT